MLSEYRKLTYLIGSILSVKAEVFCVGWYQKYQRAAAQNKKYHQQGDFGLHV